MTKVVHQWRFSNIPRKNSDVTLQNKDFFFWRLPLFYYFTVQLQLLCVCVCVCVGVSTVSFSLLSWPCKILIQVFIVLKHRIMCIFLIHSDSLLRMSTALFNLVSNTQKSTCNALRDLGSVTIWRLHGRSNACECMLTLFSTFISFLSVWMS